MHFDESPMTTATKPDFTRCPHIISFINSKGGTGKTMFVLHTVTHILAGQPDTHILILDGVRGSAIPTWLKTRQFYLSGNRPTSYEAHRVAHRGIPFYADPDVYYDSSLAMGSINVQPIADDIDWPDLWQSHWSRAWGQRNDCFSR